MEDLLSFFVDLLRTLNAQLEIGFGPVSRSPTSLPPPPPTPLLRIFYSTSWPRLHGATVV